MLVEIKVTNDKGEYLIEAEAGMPISKVLREHQLLELPCGGSGTCGKCLIYTDTVPTVEECKRLAPSAIESGLRLACYTLARKNLSLSIPPRAKTKVLTAFANTSYEFLPLIELKEFAIKKSTLENQKTDVQNLLESCSASSCQLTLEQQAGLPSFLRSNETGYALLKEGTVYGFRTNGQHTLLAVDIGTTTVAAMIMDLTSETVLEVYGEQNDQGVFGADVISRIEHSISGGADGIAQLQATIVRQINRIKDTLLSMLSARGIEAADPNIIAITGNTSMIHFLCGFPAEHIGKAPFIPVTLDSVECHASELKIDSQASVYLMPGISAYVGGDIVASLLAADAHKQKEPFILVDFGTNAEIVLGDGNNTYYACSTAAGPCFEGATLSCGMVAQPGAIDTVFKTKDGFSYTTIDKEKAAGVCGSAVIDCISLLLKSGDLDESGRLEGGGELSDFISTGENGQALFSITKDVFLSQEDIRKIQLAKAAVRAGIETLLQDSGIAPEKITNLFLAGGFGNALKPESAVRTGLVPIHMENVIRVLGNAAGCGVIRYATEKDARSIVNHIKACTQYIELSVHSGFTDEFINQMVFPKQEKNAELLQLVQPCDMQKSALAA
jgi:uncharacterized 2Fe-2S/4Fe-4S cluster protein (DUF4445 family)